MAELFPVEIQAASEYLEAEAARAAQPDDGQRPRAPGGPPCKAEGCGRPTNPAHEGYCLSHLRRYKMFGPSLGPPV